MLNKQNYKPTVSRKRLTYIAARVSAGLVPAAIRLCWDGYAKIRIYRNRCGDLIFAGLLDSRVDWRDRMFVEEFYLETARPWVDLSPTRTIWGTFQTGAE